MATAVTAALGCCGKGKSQQAARQQDAEFAHELFPRDGLTVAVRWLSSYAWRGSAGSACWLSQV